MCQYRRMRKRRRKTISPGHPFLPPGRYLYYRYVMAMKLGRKLRKDEHVHHRNGKANDDRPENLEVLTATEHARITNTGRKYSLRSRKRMSRAQLALKKRLSPEARAKIAAANRGKRWSEEKKRAHSSTMYAHFEKHPKQAPTGRPWLEMKVSRRTWYRWRKKLS